MNEILSKIYSKGDGQKPTICLYHYVGGVFFNARAHDVIKAQGFIQGALPSRWEAVNEMIPNRPLGIFFWGDDNAERNGWHLSVTLDKLDADKLFAFPMALASAAASACYGDELVEGAREALLEAHAVPFAEYNGEFAAEFIYTGDIPLEAIEWKEE